MTDFYSRDSHTSLEKLQSDLLLSEADGPYFEFGLFARMKGTALIDDSEYEDKELVLAINN